jgi:hypothetical protein
VKTSSEESRLVKFVFSGAQTYILEFGDEYVRVFKGAAPVTVSGLPAWAGGTTYDEADLVSFGGVNYYSRQSGNIGNQPDVSPTWWYAMTGSIYEFPSPYDEADVGGLNFVQSGDVITITDHLYAPYDLKRFGDTDWVFEKIQFLPAINRPRAATTTVGAAGAIPVVRYKVTAIDDITLEESLACTEALQNIAAITQANPAVVSVNADLVTGQLLSNGDEVLLEGIVGMTELNDRVFQVANVTLLGGPVTTFELVGEDSTGYGAYVSGGTVGRIHTQALLAAVPTPANPNIITWTAVTGAGKYRIFKEVNGVFGLLGEAIGTTFNDDGATADTSATEPEDRQPFLFAGDFPATVAYFQQRRAFANTLNKPEDVWMTRIGFYTNLTKQTPVDPDHQITFQIRGNEFHEVQHLLEVGRPVVLTVGGEWTLEGDAGGVLTPTAVNPRQHGHWGASAVRPVPIGSNALYVQARGRIVRDFRFAIEANGYIGRDLTTFAPHFFVGASKNIEYWDFQQIPHSVVWAVQTDGSLIGLTYMPDHEVWGWHRHDTGASGLFRDVAVIPEGDEDAVYFIVERTIDGSTVKYIERAWTRELQDQRFDSRFMDSHLIYDGVNLTLAGKDLTATMTLTGGAPWTKDSLATCTASANTFAAGDVGNQVVLFSGDEVLRVEITAFTNPTTVTVKLLKDADAVFQGTAISNWWLAVDQVAGLDHLEGETVKVYAEGHVEPDNSVSSGEVTLTQPFGFVVIGLPKVDDLETLDLDTLDGETLLDKQKRINLVTILVEESRGIFAGPDADHLEEFKQSERTDYDDPVPLLTGLAEIALECAWLDHGRVFIRQTDPLPLTVLSIIPSGFVGDS